MGLIGNHTVLGKSCGTTRSGSTVSNVRSNYGKPGAQRARFLGWTSTTMQKKSSFPEGYPPGEAIVIAQSSGGLGASPSFVAGTGAVGSANLAGGLNAESPLVGSGDVTNAALGLILSAVASLTGSGDAAGDMKGVLGAAAALAGAGDLVGSLNALGFQVAALSGAGDITGTSSSPGSMSASIVVTGDVLSTANVAEAVWGAVAEGVITYDQLVRIIGAAVAGKVSGGPGSPVFRNLSDTQNQISGTADSSGNRSAATYGD